MDDFFIFHRTRIYIHISIQTGAKCAKNISIRHDAVDRVLTPRRQMPADIFYVIWFIILLQQKKY